MISNEEVIGLHNALEANETVMVVFEKADGKLREMVCTISPEASHQTYERSEGAKPHTKDTDPDNQLVWEPSIKQWRKFKYSSVQRWAVSH